MKKLLLILALLLLSSNQLFAASSIISNLPPSGVTANTYGSGSLVPVLQIDTYGRITSASTTAVAGGGGTYPAFSGYLSATQTISNNTATKIAIDTEYLDTNNNFNTTNNRFTPTVAGNYLIEGTAAYSLGTLAAVSPLLLSVYKNGSEFRRINVNVSIGIAAIYISISAIVNMNGSTDYVELFAKQITGSDASLTSGSVHTNFQGTLLPISS